MIIQTTKMRGKRHFLFSYGTLQSDRVQLANYGRLLKGKKDSLTHYKLERIKITDKEVLKKSDQAFHPIAIKTHDPNDVVNGTIFEITASELVETDKYEVGDYKRVLETFASGQQAWVYVAK